MFQLIRLNRIFDVSPPKGQRNCSILIVLATLLKSFFQVENLLHDLRFSIDFFCTQLRNLHLSHRFNQPKQWCQIATPFFCKELAALNHHGLNVIVYTFLFVLSLLQIYTTRQSMIIITCVRKHNKLCMFICLYGQSRNKYFTALSM